MMRYAPGHVGDGRDRRRAAARGGRCRAVALRAGIAILEMVLVLPILLMLSFGVVDYGYFFYVKSTVQSAAQAGARAAIVSGATNTAVTSAVANSLTLSGMQNSGYTVTTSPTDITTGTTGTAVNVTVSVSWGTVGYHLLPTLLGGIPSTKQVTGAAAMRKE